MAARGQQQEGWPLPPPPNNSPSSCSCFLPAVAGREKQLEKQKDSNLAAVVRRKQQTTVCFARAVCYSLFARAVCYMSVVWLCLPCRITERLKHLAHLSAGEPLWKKPAASLPSLLLCSQLEGRERVWQGALDRGCPKITRRCHLILPPPHGYGPASNKTPCCVLVRL